MATPIRFTELLKGKEAEEFANKAEKNYRTAKFIGSTSTIQINNYYRILEKAKRF